MRREGLPAVVVETFRRAWERLARGETGLLSKREIEPLAGVPSADELAGFAAAGRAALSRAVVIKLNGGLGTSMGMTQAKSLLPAKNGLSFLEIAARQVMRLRESTGARVPFLLMNSFRTRDDSRAALAGFPDLSAGLPADFLQHKVPKVRVDDLSPLEWPKDPAHEWCPPGHGDLYPALVTSGLLESLLASGRDLAFVSNSDNLGATLDPAILGWVAEEKVPFALEVADRTEVDKKGGHLARRRADGRVILREVAQCPADEIDDFQDVAVHRFFNTNTLWIDLRAVHAALAEGGGVIELPIIRNEKPADPTDRTSPRVVQLETAMGAAISVFEGARALRVPRERFLAVKTTGDLLALASDLFELTGEFRIACAPGRRPGDLPIDLDAAHFARIDQLEARIPRGAPSLRECTRLVVRGDVTFGARVRCRGDVVVAAEDGRPRILPDDAVLG